MSVLVPTRRLGDWAVETPPTHGTTWLSRCVDPARGLVARVREPDPHVVDDAWFQQLFVGGLQQRVALQSAGVPRVLSTWGRDGVVLAAVEERIDGLPWRHVAGSRPPPAVALCLASQLAASLQAAGDTDLFLTPSALCVEKSGRLRLDPDMPSERARQAVGAAALVLPALDYVAPEQLFGEATTARTGMFVLGIVVYELLGGRHPASGTSRFRGLGRLARHGLPPLASHRPDLAPELCAFVDRCAALKAEERFSGWAELRACLAAVRGLFPPTTNGQAADWLRAAVAFDAWTRPPAVPEVDLADLEALAYEPVALPTGTPQSARPPRHDLPVGTTCAGADFRPMLRAGDSWIDLQPVTEAEFARFRPGGPDGDVPRVMVSHAEASAYAEWAGKRLPREEEWEAAVGHLGSELRGVGRVWEWTADGRDGRHVVRGGRWRDAWEAPGAASNRSFETGPAADVGFRCVMDALDP